MAKLLDLFCGAGGCAMGYHRAGFTEIVGVDVHPQRNYPFSFVQGDALAFLAAHGREFDAIHASPPCQAYSVTRHLPNVSRDHPALIVPTRELLVSSGKPWVMENVEGAPMRPPAVRLCGLMFGLRVFRHRWFESSQWLFAPDHIPHGDRRIGVDGYCSLAGNGGGSFSGYGDTKRPVPADHRCKAAWRRASGIDWMTSKEMAQAIPPAYTEYLGCQLLRQIENLLQEEDI